MHFRCEWGVNGVWFNLQQKGHVQFRVLDNLRVNDMVIDGSGVNDMSTQGVNANNLTSSLSPPPPPPPRPLCLSPISQASSYGTSHVISLLDQVCPSLHTITETAGLVRSVKVRHIVLCVCVCVYVCV